MDEAGGISLKLYKIIKRKAGLEGKKACLRQEVGRKATIGVKNERKGNALWLLGHICKIFFPRKEKTMTALQSDLQQDKIRQWLWMEIETVWNWKKSFQDHPILNMTIRYIQ